MNVCVTGGEREDKDMIHASLWRAERLAGGGFETVYEQDERETPSGIYGSRAYGQAVLSFSLPPCGDCTVEIVPLEGGKSRTVTLDSRSLTLPLPEEPSRYIVRGEFSGGNGERYRAEFRFELGGLDTMFQ